MAEYNKVYVPLKPELPKVIQQEQIYVYAPRSSRAGMKSISSFNITAPVASVQYDTTDGITVTGNSSLVSEEMSGETSTQNFQSEFRIPIRPGKYINIDATADNDAVGVKVDETALELDYYKIDKTQKSSTIPYWDGTKAGTLKAASGAVKNSIVQRDANGRAQFGEPVNDADAATKSFVENGIEAVTDAFSIVNLVDMSNLYKGYVSENGELIPDTTNGERSSDYIDVIGGASYTLRVITKITDTTGWCAVAFFDANKTLLSRPYSVNRTDKGTYFETLKTFIAPENAAFARVSARLYGNGFMEFYKGDIIKPFSTSFPYNEQLEHEYFGAVLPSIANSSPFFRIDTKANTFTIPRDTVLLSKRLKHGWVSTGENAELYVSLSSITGTSAIKIYYDIDTGELAAFPYYKIADRNRYILLCCYRKNLHAFGSCPVLIDGCLYSKASVNSNLTNENVKSINHRGYNSVAPENTLSAYRLSKQFGFEYVECDVSFTSDNVAVLLHDSTVDRTSNGTGSINQLTFEEVRALDFGSWKSTKYTGEKIPSFEEFILLCRNLGLHPYIEIKGGTEAQIKSLIDTVKKCGMAGNVSYISFSGTCLGCVKNYDSKARLGLVCNDITETTISTANGLKNETNEVFIDAATASSEEAVTLCIQNDIPLEVWSLNTVTNIRAANAYISGFTTDSVVAGKVLIDENI